MRRGFLVLAVLLVSAILVTLALWPSSPEPQPAFSSSDTLAAEHYTVGDGYRRHTMPSRFRAHKSKGREGDGMATGGDEYRNMWRVADSARYAKKREVTVELNSADTLSLQMLHGIGPAYARRIVRYRERLGGFVDLRQLKEVYGFTDELYRHVVTHLTLCTDSVRHIAVNSASIKELMRHPYIDAYQARDIVRWRDSGHRYSSPDDLRLVASVDDSTLAHLRPYLVFD